MKRSDLVALAAVAVAVVVLATGCSSFLHFSDPTLDDAVTDACDLLATKHKAELEAQAKQKLIPFPFIRDVFVDACRNRLAEGLEPAKTAGLYAAARAGQP